MTTIHVSDLKNARVRNAADNWHTLKERFSEVGVDRPVPISIDLNGKIYHGEAKAESDGDSAWHGSIEVTGLKAGAEKIDGIAIRFVPHHLNRVIQEVGTFDAGQISIQPTHIKLTPTLASRRIDPPARGDSRLRRTLELQQRKQEWSEVGFSIPGYPGLIALITDFGQRDSYVGEVKGAILHKNPKATVVEITHQVPKFDIRTGSYLLGKSAKAFPERTVFLGVIDPGVGTSRESIAVETWNGNRFIVPNNGLLTHTLNKNQIRAAHRIENRFFLGDSYSDQDKTFHGRDVFGPAAAVLAYGLPLGWIGPLIDHLVNLPIASAIKNGSNVTGEVEHVDHYGNVVTNIPRELLDGFKFGDNLTIDLGDRTLGVDYVETYAKTPKGTLVGVITSDHTFEIARNQGSANETLNLKPGDKISIRGKQLEPLDCPPEARQNQGDSPTSKPNSATRR